jgi:membrane fusion protein (multidrug efflux system)
MNTKIKKRVIVVILLIICVLCIIFFGKIKSFFTNESESSGVSIPAVKAKQPLSVKALVLHPDTLIDLFRTKGLLIPDEEVALSFETSGKIVKILFEEGTLVSKGTLLAKVNDETLQAELRKLETQLPLAEERVFRQKALYERDAVSKETYEAVTTELEKLKADIELVKARVRQTELRAPFDGEVGLRVVSEGAYASPNTVITTLTKMIPLKLEFSVNEKQANDIRPGTPVHFTIENDSRVYTATVYAVESKLDANTLSLKVRARYANADGKLRPGYSANVEVKVREIKNAIVIPGIATVAEMGHNIAFVYRAGMAKRVQLTCGTRTASSIQIIDGLSVGDTLLTTGVMQLRDDLQVVISELN